MAAAALAVAAAATAWGLAALWPSAAQVADAAERVPFLAAGTTFETGEVLGLEPGCEAPANDPRGDASHATGGGPEHGAAGSGSAEPGPADRGTEQGADRTDACTTLSLGLRSGADAGRVVDLPLRGALADSGLQRGDRVELMAHPVPTAPDSGAAAHPRSGLANEYSVAGVLRGLPLALLALAFAAVVVVIGRLRGLLALLALGISAGVILAFLLPALVTGAPGLLVGVVASSAIMFVTLYLVHGLNTRTTSALLGTLCGIAIMAGVSLLATQATRLSGIGDEASGVLAGMTQHIDFRGLLTCSVIIAGLGVLNDVTITQASSVWELRAAAPAMPRRELYASAMRIGRDHIASTVYTVFFAYVGAALGALILLFLYDRPLLSLLTHEDIAIEIVRTLCGSIGLVLAVPITTWAAVWLVPDADRLPDRMPGHSHAVRPPG